MNILQYVDKTDETLELVKLEIDHVERDSEDWVTIYFKSIPGITTYITVSQDELNQIVGV